MNYEVSKQLPVKPGLTCPWCGCMLHADKHLIQKTRAMYRCPSCGQLTNYRDITSAPTMYEALPQKVRDRLDNWLMDRFVHADGKQADTENTYVLKHRVQLQTETYLYSGCLNGALLHLGFRPRDTMDTNWTFHMRWKKPSE